jgi:hypothetical protein
VEEEERRKKNAPLSFFATRPRNQTNLTSKIAAALTFVPKLGFTQPIEAARVW